MGKLQLPQNIKEYEDLGVKKDVGYPEIKEALEWVGNYVHNNGRVLYGGMAIDMNLKKSGHEGIYKEGNIPDYDFFSTTYYEESCEIADKLYEMGYHNISAINALHVSSRRVRVNFVSVADLSYIPPSVYFPTQEYEGFKVVHPWFQLMDMYKSLAFPYSGPPRENIMNRYEKDIKRLNMLVVQYPLESVMKSLGIKSHDVHDVHDACIVRELAMELVRLVPDFGVITGFYQIMLQHPHIAAKYMSEQPLCIVTPEWSKMLEWVLSKVTGEVKYHSRYLDDVKSKYITVTATEGLEIHIIAATRDLIIYQECEGVRVSNYWYLCQHLLMRYFHEKDVTSLYLYEEVKGYASVDTCNGLNHLGDNNVGLDYVIYYRERAGENILRPSFGYYPNGSGNKDNFNYDISPLFKMNGEEITESLFHLAI